MEGVATAGVPGGRWQPWPRSLTAKDAEVREIPPDRGDCPGLVNPSCDAEPSRYLRPMRWFGAVAGKPVGLAEMVVGADPVGQLPIEADAWLVPVESEPPTSTTVTLGHGVPPAGDDATSRSTHAAVNAPHRRKASRRSLGTAGPPNTDATW